MKILTFLFCVSSFSNTNVHKDSQLQISKCFALPFEVMVS